MEEKIRDRLANAILDRVFPGAVVGIVGASGIRSVIPVGRFTYDLSSPRVSEETIYDVASITKSIPVSSLALKLIDEKKLSLHDHVTQYLQELQNNPFCRDVLIRHYVTMTLDYSMPLSSLKEKSPQDILEHIYQTKFTFLPGTKMRYANATSILLGIIIERVTGKKLDVLADEVFFHPLRMSRTTFHPESFRKDLIVPTEDDPWRGRIIQGEIHDESAYRLREMMIPGSAGLFSTVPDLLTFIQMLIQEGMYKGKQYFSPQMITQLMTNQLEERGTFGGLGWELYQERFMGTYCRKHTIGKTGFTGCMVVCDIPRKIGIVMLSNYHYPKRKHSQEVLHGVRRDIADIVFSS